VGTLEVNRWIMERLGFLSVLVTAFVLGEFPEQESTEHLRLLKCFHDAFYYLAFII